MTVYYMKLGERRVVSRSFFLFCFCLRCVCKIGSCIGQISGGATEPSRTKQRRKSIQPQIMGSIRIVQGSGWVGLWDLENKKECAARYALRRIRLVNYVSFLEGIGRIDAALKLMV
ncbi:uncharacterized protein F4822DRAFT_74618 [Hypoxylon trugodes]|uniref:uncharacterized protein n=1 Tax=Hypoxylon trugodes TaxID=326681 RepID=UPI00219F2116|nr:uncharacterized protein F4822DRAFT_74618 [Hypoxylon trugodes]KAI1383336.1 hypothetical protein F4822DRAFT_74618 [Hypoxylon trugodes]